MAVELELHYEGMLVRSSQLNGEQAWSTVQSEWTALRNRHELETTRKTKHGRELSIDIPPVAERPARGLLAYARSADGMREAYAYAVDDVVMLVSRRPDAEQVRDRPAPGDTSLGRASARTSKGGLQPAGRLVASAAVSCSLTAPRTGEVAHYSVVGQEEDAQQAAWWDDTRQGPGALVTIAMQHLKQAAQQHVWAGARDSLERAMPRTADTDADASAEAGQSDEEVLRRRQTRLALWSREQAATNQRLLPVRGMAAAVSVLQENLQALDVALQADGWRTGPQWTSVLRQQEILGRDIQDKLEWFDAALTHAALVRQSMADSAAALYTDVEQSRLQLNFLQAAVLGAVALALGVLQVLTGLKAEPSDQVLIFAAVEAPLVALFLAYLFWEAHRGYGTVARMLGCLVLLVPVAVLVLMQEDRRELLWLLPAAVASYALVHVGLVAAAAVARQQR